MVNTNDLKKKILAKRVQASLSNQDRINLKVRQVRSEYMVASAIEDEMENACDCCELLSATIEQDNCILSACYPNPKFERAQRLDRKAALAKRIVRALPRSQQTLNVLLASGAVSITSLEHFDAQLKRAG